jgi:hypothetical protein
MSHDVSCVFSVLHPAVTKVLNNMCTVEKDIYRFDFVANRGFSSNADDARVV